MKPKTVVTVNSTGRQSASFVRVAAAVGWHVRAHMHEGAGLVARELAELPNVTAFVGGLEDARLVAELFAGAELAFINTTHWGDEVTIGRSLADAAKRAGVRHYVYSSMPDHSTYGRRDWEALPLWSPKFAVENYVRQIGLPATFVYTGIYHNNFTSLPYPLFRLELQPDTSFVWEAPFHPDDPLPWLDAEHDVGPAVLQIFKQGLRKWSGHRICLAFSLMTPVAVCAAFSRALARPVRYRRGPIHVAVSVPAGYEEHLRVLEATLGDRRAPYFGPDLQGGDGEDCTREALLLWEGPRSMEEYAREVFPVEEAANGLTWMEEEPRTPGREAERDYFPGSC